VKDLGPVKTMPLVYLDCRDIRARDFSPLTRMPLQSIWIDDPDGKVQSILKSMPRLRMVNGAPW